MHRMFLEEYARYRKLALMRNKYDTSLVLEVIFLIVVKT